VIRTNAAIIQGNSGGPVFDDRGQVIGAATFTSFTRLWNHGVDLYVRDLHYRALPEREGRRTGSTRISRTSSACARTATSSTRSRDTSIGRSSSGA
jgi:hypothetical protein